MTIEEKITFVKEWQSGGCHPLTCGNDSDHALLEARQVSQEVHLFCPDCDYIQEKIPFIDY